MNKRTSVASRTSIKVGPDVPLESIHPVSIIFLLVFLSYSIIFVVRTDENRCQRSTNSRCMSAEYRR
jgi:hypothetical protein